MPQLQRIIKIIKKKSNKWTDIELRLENKTFFLTQKELDFLKKIEKNNEYKYEIDDFFIINLDHSPRKIEEGIKNEEFIKNYKDNINKKFFISYYIRRIDDGGRT